MEGIVFLTFVIVTLLPGTSTGVHLSMTSKIVLTPTLASEMVTSFSDRITKVDKNDSTMAVNDSSMEGWFSPTPTIGSVGTLNVSHGIFSSITTSTTNISPSLTLTINKNSTIQTAFRTSSLISSMSSFSSNEQSNTPLSTFTIVQLSTMITDSVMPFSSSLDSSSSVMTPHMSSAFNSIPSSIETPFTSTSNLIDMTSSINTISSVTVSTPVSTSTEKNCTTNCNKARNSKKKPSAGIIVVLVLIAVLFSALVFICIRRRKKCGRLSLTPPSGGRASYTRFTDDEDGRMDMNML